MYMIQYWECNHREVNYFNKGNIAVFGFQYDLEKRSEGAGNSGWQSVLSMSDKQRGQERRQWWRKREGKSACEAKSTERNHW